MDNNFEIMVDNLEKIDILVWGRYAIQRDILYKKIKKEDYDDLILNANECGNEYAKKIMEEFNTNDPLEICENYNIKIIEGETKPGTQKLLLASFTTSNKIFISTPPIAKAYKLLKGLNKSYYSKMALKDTILSHELFHYVENKYKKEIYTQTKKIVLWKIFGFKSTSNLRVLSEIAAMSFAKTLANVEFSPYMLDIIMLYPYDKKKTLDLYENIIKIKDEYENEKK